MVHKNDVVQFKTDWDEEPTPRNTAIVHRVAKDGSWADVHTPYGTKRITHPSEHLKVINQPIVINI